VKSRSDDCQAQESVRTPRASLTRYRECVTLRDATECLLEAYDCIVKRAYERVLAQMESPAGNPEMPPETHRAPAPDIPVSIENSGEAVYVLATIPEAGRVRVSVGIDSDWLVILAHAAPDDHARALASSEPGAGRQPERSAASGDPDRAQAVSVVKLPADVDPQRAVAILSDGLLAIRMPKLSA
jgi:HSP20 family molecular chaperone IbpA